MELQAVQKAIVAIVTADPEPANLVPFEKAERTVGEGHASGIDRFAVVDLLELEARVAGIIPE